MGQQTGNKGPSDIVLHKGQAYCGQLEPGTVLRVATGAVVLVQHLALEQAHVSLRTTLQRGGAHGMERAMWVEVQALTDAQLQLYAPEVVTIAQLLRNWLPAWPLWRMALRRLQMHSRV